MEEGWGRDGVCMLEVILHQTAGACGDRTSREYVISRLVQGSTEMKVSFTNDAGGRKASHCPGRLSRVMVRLV